jgi:hypothetical protein
MLDDLRDDADFVDEEENDYEYQESVAGAGTQTLFFGMTPAQRFMIALMIFMMICILGSFFLLITEKVWLPV